MSDHASLIVGLSLLSFQVSTGERTSIDVVEKRSDFEQTQLAIVSQQRLLQAGETAGQCRFLSEVMGMTPEIKTLLESSIVDSGTSVYNAIAAYKASPFSAYISLNYLLTSIAIKIENNNQEFEDFGVVLEELGSCPDKGRNDDDICSVNLWLDATFFFANKAAKEYDLPWLSLGTGDPDLVRVLARPESYYTERVEALRSKVETLAAKIREESGINLPPVEQYMESVKERGRIDKADFERINAEHDAKKASAPSHLYLAGDNGPARTNPRPIGFRPNTDDDYWN